MVATSNSAEDHDDRAGRNRARRLQATPQRVPLPRLSSTRLLWKRRPVLAQLENALGVLLGFQKSAYSDRNSINFTINVMVVPRSDWDSFRSQSPSSPARPTPNAHYSREIGGVRIGTLDRVNSRDKWWTLQPGSNLEPIEADVLHDVDTWALPWMRAQITGQ